MGVVTAMALEVLQFRSDPGANFSYLVFSPPSRTAVVVDPSLDPAPLLRRIEELQLQVELLINTHGHGDHTAGNAEVLKRTGARHAAHPLDLPRAEIALSDGQRLALGDAAIEVLHTPGHSPGSITLGLGGALLTGDTLFVTRCGRADLAGSNPAALYRSLCRLARLPAATLVYPGHDYGPKPVSSIGFELAHNPYLQCTDLEQFIALRMG